MSPHSKTGPGRRRKSSLDRLLFQANISATKLASLRARATLKERRDSPLNFETIKTKMSTSFALKRKANSHSKVKESSKGGYLHLYPTDSAIGFLNTFLWIAIYLVDSRLSSFWTTGAWCKENLRVFQSAFEFIKGNGIWNPGLWNLNAAQGIRNPTNNWNPEAKFHWQIIWIHFLESGIQDCLGFP